MCREDESAVAFVLELGHVIDIDCLSYDMLKAR
jgi:hypothetical protein